MSSALPVLFVSHGAPTFALEPGLAGPQLTALGQRLSGVETVLVLSPHWMTRRGTRVMTTPAPETIHDFNGFPQALYGLRYPAAGSPALAREALALLQQSGYSAASDDQRGLDHGAWVPLMHLYPGASVPVFQVSMPYPLDPRAALALGRVLSPLRERGVLIVASGCLTHNLREFRQHAMGHAPYAVAFAHWVREALAEGDVERLLEYRRLAPHAERAHPTEEHFLPLFVAVGAAGDTSPVTVIDGGISDGVLAMDAYVLGAVA